MNPFERQWIRLVAPMSLTLLPVSAAYAQRIPDAAVWWAGAGLLAPFLAVPVKFGILRLSALKATASQLWILSAIEWLIWFPLGYIVLRYVRTSPPFAVLLLFGMAVFLHRARVAGAPWACALYLSVPTPVLAIALPFLAFVLHAFLET